MDGSTGGSLKRALWVPRRVWHNLCLDFSTSVLPMNSRHERPNGRSVDPSPARSGVSYVEWIKSRLDARLVFCVALSAVLAACALGHNPDPPSAGGGLTGGTTAGTTGSTTGNTPGTSTGLDVTSGDAGQSSGGQAGSGGGPTGGTAPGGQGGHCNDGMLDEFDEQDELDACEMAR